VLTTRRGLLLSACLMPGAFASAPARFSDRLWSAIAGIYAETLKHPFLTGLTDGTLPKDRFDFYLKQDSLYLVAFAEALGVLASKAPRVDWMITLNQHAIDCVKTERQLHESLLRGAAAKTMAPVNYAYSNHFLATVHRKPFAEGLCALLPCYWIYWEVGRELRKRGSRNKDYAKWIEQYSSEEYGKTVQLVLDMINEESARLDEERKQSCVDLFVTSSRYEYLFWDMAWRLEAWKP
jgi:thiaminase (transcriptional activator TenA)